MKLRENENKKIGPQVDGNNAIGPSYTPYTLDTHLFRGGCQETKFTSQGESEERRQVNSLCIRQQNGNGAFHVSRVCVCVCVCVCVDADIIIISGEESDGHQGASAAPGSNQDDQKEPTKRRHPLKSRQFFLSRCTAIRLEPAPRSTR